MAVPNALPVGRASTWLRVSVGFLVVAFVSPIYMVVCLFLLPSRVARIWAGNAYGKIIGSAVFTLIGARMRISQKERMWAEGPALFVANHASTLDMWVGMWLCPWGGCGTAKKEIIRLPFFGQTYLLSGHLLVNRGDRGRAIAAMERVGALVRKHRLAIWMWPEGTRSTDGRLQPMKKGFVHLAIATGLPVVPVVFHNAHQIWPARRWQFTPGDLHIDVLERIDTRAWTAETTDQHVDEVWRVFAKHLGEGQKPGPGVTATSPAPEATLQPPA